MIEQSDNIYEQLDNIFPSAKSPLYRRLMADEELTYLRDRGGIIGFELDLSKNQLLAGFLLIAIQKHTVYAYRSDLDEEYELVLFPPLDKMFDNTFEMLDLYVTKKLYMSDDFKGRRLKSGRLRDLSEDFKPSDEEDIKAKDVSKRLNVEMDKYKPKVKAPVKDMGPATIAPPVDIQVEDEFPPMNDFGQDGFDEFDEGGFNNFDDYEGGLGPDFDPFDEGFDDVEEPVIDWRIKELKESNIEDLATLGEFVEVRLEVPKPVATQVLNKALQSEVVVSKKMKSVDLAILLFEKLFEDGKL